MRFISTRALIIAIFLLPAPLVTAQTRDASFVAEGPNYVVEASGRGASEADAQNDALRSAIAVLMESLAKDKLYADLFLKNPPLTMSWKKLSSEKGMLDWSVRLRLVIDDESLRILYNVTYVSTVANLLDSAEARLAEAETLSAEARTAETNGQLGKAMGLYWQARDAADAGIEVLRDIGDAAIFSALTKKKAPELREVLAALRGSAVSGYERIRQAERSLIEDEELSSALATLAAIDDDVASVELWAESLPARVARVETTPRAELVALSDDMETRQRLLSDSRLALSRVEGAVPKAKEIARARMDVLRKRIDRTASYLAKARQAVDREIRSPAIVRAKRAQNIRWIFLHEPSGALAFRFYTPFGLDPAAKDISFLDTGLFEFGLRAEGAFGGERGIWIASTLEKDDAALAATAPGGGAAKNTGYGQSIDLGFYGRGLFGLGFSWDWLRRVDGESVEKRPALRAVIGGMDSQRGRASWHTALSWELPYELGYFETLNIFNVGLDAILRLGGAVELGAAFSWRLRENAWEDYDSVLRYSAGIGIRLPKPFLWGFEFAGHAASDLGSTDTLSLNYIRMFLEYSL